MTLDSNKNNLWIGFDLGGTKMMSIVLDNNFKVIARERKKSKSQGDKSVSIDRIIKTINESLERLPKPVPTLSGIGLGVPGTLELEKGIIIEAPNLGWKKITIKSIIEKEFNCPVVICNDVDAGIYGEYSFGAGQNGRCVLVCFQGLVLEAALFTMAYYLQERITPV